MLKYARTESRTSAHTARLTGVCHYHWRSVTNRALSSACSFKNSPRNVASCCPMSWPNPATKPLQHAPCLKRMTSHGPWKVAVSSQLTWIFSFTFLFTCHIPNSKTVQANKGLVASSSANQASASLVVRMPWPAGSHESPHPREGQVISQPKKWINQSTNWIQRCAAMAPSHKALQYLPLQLEATQAALPPRSNAKATSTWRCLHGSGY